MARDLVGCLLCRRTEDGVIVGQVSETEAYVGRHDLASHSRHGPTKRNQVMFGEPGHAYVYLIYGMYHCLNVVTEPPGRGTAVLFRALLPHAWFPRRKGATFSSLPRMDGPGKLCRALNLDRRFNGLDLCQAEEIWIAARADRRRLLIRSGPRVGVDYAGEWAKQPLRFWLEP